MNFPEGSQNLSLPIWKKLLFSCSAVIIFFVFIEITLTVCGLEPYSATEDPFVGFAKNIPLFVEQTQPEGTVMFATAQNKLYNFNAQQFPKIKGNNSFRIFCMGGSTTYGRPYDDHSISFCGWLREFLHSADPSRNWEVINAGGVSYASYRVAALMDELSHYQPDLFIIYSGHNEFLEERIYRTTKELPDSIIRLTSHLSKTRIYTAMKKTADFISKKTLNKNNAQYILEAEVHEILNDTVGPTSYIRDDILQQQILAHFTFNLRRMVAIARSAGSEIIFVTPASNLKDMSPFKSEHSRYLPESEKERFNSLFEQGKTFQKSGKLSETVEVFNEALSIDNRYADLHFSLGKALFELRNFDDAKASFIRAKDEDICPLRILSPMHEAVLNIAEEENIPLIDFITIVEDSCYNKFGHRIPGKEYFLDHVHLTFESNRMLAMALFNKLIEMGIVMSGSSLNSDVISEITNRLKQSIDKEKHAYALMNLGSILDWAGRSEEAYRVYLEAYDTLGDDVGLLVFLAKSSDRLGERDRAILYMQKAFENGPLNPRLHYYMAELFEEQGAYDDALTHYNESLRDPDALRHNEHLIEAHVKIARILSSQGRFNEALAHYAEMLKIRPHRDDIHTNSGVLLLKAGDLEEAISHLKEALRINPYSLHALYNMGMVSTEMDKLDEATAYYSKLLQIDPNHIEAYNSLGVVLAKQGHVDEAIDHFIRSLNINPRYLEAHYNLGMAYEQQGLIEKSRFHFTQAEKIRSELSLATKK